MYASNGTKVIWVNFMHEQNGHCCMCARRAYKRPEPMTSKQHYHFRCCNCGQKFKVKPRTIRKQTT